MIALCQNFARMSLLPQYEVRSAKSLPILSESPREEPHPGLTREMSVFRQASRQRRGLTPIRSLFYQRCGRSEYGSTILDHTRLEASARLLLQLLVTFVT